jgi:hypothetical protein
VTMRHPIRGLLVGPLVAPIVYWIGVTAYAWGGDFRLDWVRALRELAAITVFGLPIAYAATLFWGVPMLYALSRAGWLRAATLVAAGAAGGTSVAILFVFCQQGALIRVQMPLPGGAVLGALVGGACWWAGQGRSEQFDPAA